MISVLFSECCYHPLIVVLFQGVVIIHEIFDGGAVARDGRLAIGDQILEVV